MSRAMTARPAASACLAVPVDPAEPVYPVASVDPAASADPQVPTRAAVSRGGRA